MPETVSVTVHIDAPAETVWSMVTDLPRMGEWSPENTGGSWAKGSTGPALGARFKGTNRNGIRRWSTGTEIVVFDEPTHFAFETVAGPIRAARWSYRIAPSADGGGCDVTETWDDLRGPVFKPISAFATGVKDRAEHCRTAMRTTLENLKAAAEA
ncbi:MAG TPA: SRPBCC family protein [Acidimicrobiales bacterium]|nr:SRPBCC family protein [Acidimicrobiales bacterium]